MGLPSIEGIVEHLLTAPEALVLTFVFLLPALEASILVGVFFPGEVVVLLGGVVASEGHTPLAAVLVAAIAGAITGDAIGFEVGKRWGPWIIAHVPDRLIPPEHVVRGLDVLRRLGWKAVILGRWTAVLRALVPGLAGMSGMRTRTFLVSNAIGGGLWATAVVLAGYAAGQSWRRVKDDLGSVTTYGFLAIVVVVVAWLLVRKRRADRLAPVDDEPLRP
jgi:undecaprenyl-diphosphatase